MFNNISPTAVLITYRKWKRHGGIRQANDDNIILLMPFVYWITKTTNTYTEYVICFCSHCNMIAPKHLNIMLHIL
jgi:hypothetical protein